MTNSYETFSSHLTTLLSLCPPHFIYVNDPENPRIASSAIRSVLSQLSEDPSLFFRYASIDAISCFTQRLLYDSVLNSLAGWTPTWEDGCTNWSSDGTRYNENIDTFLHGLRAIQSSLQRENEISPSKVRKWKGKATTGAESCRLVVMIERAERLKDNLPDLLVPLTRLAELARLDITTILLSDVPWEDIRPTLGASPEPYYMDAPLMSKQATLEMLVSFFPPSNSPCSHVDPDAYNPVLKPLYDHFVATLYSICAPFTRDPYELAYIAASRWPGFVQPVLDAHRLRLQTVSGAEAVSDSEEEMLIECELHPILAPPAEDIRIRLMRLFTPSFTAALEALYPRMDNAADWAKAHMPPPNLLAIPPMQVPREFSSSEVSGPHDSSMLHVEALPRLAKFVLVASFLASTNPPKSDLRMFGRGRDERAKRRRRKGGSPRKSKAGSTTGSVKIPQRLLGPTPFPIDRMIVILGVLLEENDVETRPSAPQYTHPGEYTDMEISRVALYAQVMELASMRLLLRTSPPDKLDATPMFKCGISYAVALRVAKDVEVALHDLMWEPV